MSTTDGTLEVDRQQDAGDRDDTILLTNDDGIGSPGLRLLAAALAEDHRRVLVAAPAREASGSGTGIGVYLPEDPTRLARHDVDGVKGYAIDGPPGMAVMAAALGAFGPPPRLVVSGINAGINTGHSVLHSGTVGGALTAMTFGIRGVALSAADRDDGSFRWDTAVEVAREVVHWMLECEPRTVLNVNVPALPYAELRGARWANLDEFGHFHLASADPDGRLTLEVKDRSTGEDPGADTQLCLAGYVTLTSLRTVEPADPPADVAADQVVSLGSR